MKSFLNPASKTILWIILVAIIMTLEVQFMLDGNILYALYLLLLNTHIWLFIWPALSIIGCTPAIIKPSQPIDFQPLQIFLKIYGWTLLVGFVLMFEFLYVSGRSYFFTLEESQNYLIPFIFIWSVLPVLCLLACFIARITAPKINLLEWDKRNPIIYICIFISILLIGGIWASMILTDREKGYFPYMVIAGLLTGISLVLLKSAGSYLWEAIQNKHTGGKIYAAFYFSSLFVSAFYLFSGLLSDTYGIKQGEVLGYSLYHTLFFTRQIVLVTLSVLANMWLTSHKKRFFYFATTFLCGYNYYF
ncbi:MAG: hypothetical protein LIP01_05660 [Tannerellaceae bacterium]|nr:hypothetical protein [Tannerellaceae bacterium]